MKKNILITIIVSLSITVSLAQPPGGYIINFEQTGPLQHMRIDTTTNSNNIWQIGSPAKTIFTNGFSVPNVIVTDTVNTYPINDTSRFIISNTSDKILNNYLTISGWYYANSDTLNDFGTIEFSPDKGANWIDLVNPTTYANGIYCAQKPILTGNSNGWNYFYIDIGPLRDTFNLQLGDTLLYRFTFISDNIQTNKDGLMFDDLVFEDYAFSINEIQNDNLISIYPNPTTNKITIESKEQEVLDATIYNILGELMLKKQLSTGINEIEIGSLSKGIYFYQVSDKNKIIQIGKFIME